MKNRIATHFYLKEARKDSNGIAPIYLRITINGERAELTTDKRIYPNTWGKTAERVGGRSESARIINAKLNNLIGKVGKYYSSIDAKDEIIKVIQIINEFKVKSQNSMTLIKAYDLHIERMKELIGNDFAPNTVKRYQSSINSLKEFISKYYKRPDIRLSDLDKIFIESYKRFLQTDKGLKKEISFQFSPFLYGISSFL